MSPRGSGEPGGRRAILEVRWGPLACHKYSLEPHRTVLVGQAEPSELQIPHDKTLDVLQFDLAWDGEKGWLRNRSNQTPMQLNGMAITEGALSHGDWIRAGLTDFSFYLENPPPPSKGEGSANAHVLSALKSRGGSLFAILDAARDPRILELLHGSIDEHRSLYEGPQGDALAEVAPYLVRLHPGSHLLELLVEEGWGKSWGVYVVSPLSFKDLRRHFRRFLFVQQESSEDRLYFRFYDPRTSNIVLPILPPDQHREFFNNITSLILEAHNSTLIQLTTQPHQ